MEYSAEFRAHKSWVINFKFLNIHMRNSDSNIKILQIGDLCNVGVNLKRGLSQAGYKVKILVSSGEYQKEVGLVINPLSKFGSIKHLYTFWFVLLHFRWKCHAHGMAGIFPLVLGRRYVLHCHGSDLRELPARRGILGRLFRIVVVRASLVIVSTPDLLEAYDAQGFDVSKRRFLPNPVSISFDKKPLWQDVNKSKILLFCPSSNHELKCKLKLVEAYKKLHEKYGDRINLALINYGKSAIDLEFKNLGKKIFQTINYYRKCEHAEMVGLYQKCDIVLDQFCNIKAHGVITYEACALGKPVVSTIGERLFAGSGIQPGSTVEEIYASVSKIIDSNLYQTLGEQSYGWAKGFVSTQSVTEKLLDIYKEFIRA